MVSVDVKHHVYLLTWSDSWWYTGSLLLLLLFFLSSLSSDYSLCFRMKVRGGGKIFVSGLAPLAGIFSSFFFFYIFIRGIALYKSYNYHACMLLQGKGWLKCRFTSTETVGLLGTGAQDVHLDFHTAPELVSGQ